MDEEEATRRARRKLLKGAGFAVPVIVSTISIPARAAQATCGPSSCQPSGPCSPLGGCNPANPCNPDGGTCTPDLPCNPRR